MWPGRSLMREEDCGDSVRKRARLVAIGSCVCALLLSPCVPAAVAQVTASAYAQAAIGSIHGTVLTESTERPLLNALVLISKLGIETRTDSLGNFLLKDVPFGTHGVIVRLDGFEPLYTEITVVKGEKVGYDLLLKDRIIQYAPKAARKDVGADISRHSLEERRARGNGRFITEEILKESNGKPTADVIRSKVPALHAVKMAGTDARALALNLSSDNANQRVEPSEADRKAGAKVDCYVPVVLNRTVMYQSLPGAPLYDVNSIPSGMLMSVEYFEAMNIPSQYALAASPCGMLVIQTRGR